MKKKFVWRNPREGHFESSSSEEEGEYKTVDERGNPLPIELKLFKEKPRRSKNIGKAPSEEFFQCLPSKFRKFQKPRARRYKKDTISYELKFFTDSEEDSEEN
jgi:hypothetical protein